jgi:hypothetical protein
VNAPALRLWQRSLRYNIDQARADLDKMAANWHDGLLAHQGYTNGRIAEMERALELVGLLLVGEDQDDDQAPAPAALVTLPEADELDDDGQLWFGDYEIRVDTTGRGPAEVYVMQADGTRSAPGLPALERRAAALLAAIAAARAHSG